MNPGHLALLGIFHSCSRPMRDALERLEHAEAVVVRLVGKLHDLEVASDAARVLRGQATVLRLVPKGGA